MLKISEKICIFFIPNSAYVKKNNVHVYSLEGAMNTFWELKGLKLKKPLNIFKTVKKKTDFRFVMQLQKCVSNIKYMKLVSIIEADQGNWHTVSSYVLNFQHTLGVKSLFIILCGSAAGL